MGISADMGIRTGIQPAFAAADAQEAKAGRAGHQEEETVKGRKAGDGPGSASQPARRDEYVHGEEPADPGIYRPSARDREPGKSGESEESRKSGESGKSEECTTNTDKVDREIRKLREKKEELEQKLARSDSPEEQKKLESQLQQVERELQMKDNDSYRRRHAEHS